MLGGGEFGPVHGGEDSRTTCTKIDGHLDVCLIQKQLELAVLPSMRLYGRWAPLALSLAAVGVAGCGTSAPTAKPTVNVSITAPTSGAIVGVQHVVVAGTVTPANAQVLVAGQPAQVSGGRFTRSLLLASPHQVVTVTAQAPGYLAAQAATTVSYSPNLAAQLVASSSALTGTTNSPGSSYTPAGNALNSALALPKSASSSGPSTSAPAHKRATHTARRAPAPAHTTPAHAAPPTPTPKPTPKPAPAPAPKPAPAPAPKPAPAPAPAPPSSGGSRPPAGSPPVLTVERIRQVWDAGCLKHVKGENVVPYCTCLYNHLSARGSFKTPTTVNALLKKLHDYGKSGDLQALPRAVRRALTVCSAKMPSLTATGGQPTLTRLPGLSHKRVPFR